MKNYYQLSCLLALILFTLTVSVRAQRTISFSKESAQGIDLKSIKNHKHSLYGKLDLSLEQITQKPSKAVGRSSQSNFVNQLKQSGVILEREQRILVEVYANRHTKDLKEIWNASGFKLVSSNQRHMVGWVPLAALPKLEANQSIMSIRSIPRADTDLGEARNSGVEAMAVDFVRQNRLLDGQGVKIGILSSSYDLTGGAEDAVLGGDLPGAGNPNGYTQPVVVVREGAEGVFGPGNTDEARAMAEVVHDIAPAAELFIVGMPDGVTPLLIADGIQLLADEGVDIIVDDLTGLAEDAFYQDGLASKKIDEVVNDLGIIYFTSAGNNGKGGRQGRTRFYETKNNNDPLVPFQGVNWFPFNNTGNIGNDLFVLLEFNSPDEILDVTLQWDEPWGSLTGNDNKAVRDVRLGFYDAFSQPIGGFAPNVSGDAQVDIFGTIPETGGAVFMGIFTTEDELPSNMRLTIGERFLDITSDNVNFDASTVIGHKRAKRAIAVGAAAWFNTPRGATTWNDVYVPQIPNLVTADERQSAILGFPGAPSVLFSTGDQTTYVTNSSYGGSEILFDNDGNPLVSGETRENPWVTGADAAETTFFGQFIPTLDEYFFFGSSCSSPAVAAIGGLLLQASGNTMTPDQMRSLLKETAEDMDDPYDNGFQEDPTDPDFRTGYDLASGHGLVNANAAIEQYISTQSIEIMDMEAICQNGDERKWSIKNNNNFAIEVELSGRPIRLPGSSSFVDDPMYLLKPGNNFFYTQSRYRVTTIRAEWFDQGTKRTVIVSKEGSWPTCEDSNITASSTNTNFQDNLFVFPNPSSDGNFSIAMRTEADEEASIRVYDLSNKLILEKKQFLNAGNSQFDIRIPEKKGVYILRVAGKDTLITKRVVVQ